MKEDKQVRLGADGVSACGGEAQRKRGFKASSPQHSVLAECYLCVSGLRGPQVQPAGGSTFPAVRVNGRGRGRAQSQPEWGSHKQLGRENRASTAVINYGLKNTAATAEEASADCARHQFSGSPVSNTAQAAIGVHLPGCDL